jgi:hypothetical protein
MSRSQYGPAAGTRRGPPIKPALLHPPERIVLRKDEMLLLRSLSDYTTRGLYEALREMADFETGEIFPITYAQLKALGTPPKPQQGRPRPGPTYDVLRRMVYDLEAVGLVVRDRGANQAQGQLRLMLPYPAAAYADWQRKTLARRKSDRGKAQGFSEGNRQAKPEAKARVPNANTLS